MEKNYFGVEKRKISVNRKREMEKSEETKQMKTKKDANQNMTNQRHYSYLKQWKQQGVMREQI